MSIPSKRSALILLGLTGTVLAVVLAGTFAASRRPDQIVQTTGEPAMRAIRIDPLSGNQTILQPIAGTNGGSPTNKLACEDAGGTWNGCGSACRNKTGAEMCAQVCVEYCECASNGQCPNDDENVRRLRCTEYVDDVGVCKP